MRVVEQRVLAGRVGREGHRVRLGPRPRHIVVQRLPRSGVAYQLAEATPPAQLVLERHRVRLAIEGPRSRAGAAAAIAPAHTPGDRAIGASNPMDTHAARSAMPSSAAPSTLGYTPRRAGERTLRDGAGPGGLGRPPATHASTAARRTRGRLPT